MDLPRYAEQSRERWRAVQDRLGLSPTDGLPGSDTVSAVELELGMVATEANVDLVVPDFHGHNFGGERIRSHVDRDPRKLIPSFAANVGRLFTSLRVQGHDPLCWETYRSPARAQVLTKKGTGVRLSMHLYGAAVDIVEADSMWGASTAFWDAVGETAEELGMYVLRSNGKRIDRPHVQAIPQHKQNLFRSMTDAARIQYVDGLHVAR